MISLDAGLSFDYMHDLKLKMSNHGVTWPYMVEIPIENLNSNIRFYYLSPIKHLSQAQGFFINGI